MKLNRRGFFTKIATGILLANITDTFINPSTTFTSDGNFENVINPLLQEILPSFNLDEIVNAQPVNIYE